MHSGSLHERPGIVPVHNSRWATSNKSFKFISSPVKRYATALSSAKTSENIATAKNDGEFILFVGFSRKNCMIFTGF